MAALAWLGVREVSGNGLRGRSAPATEAAHIILGLENERRGKG